MNRPTPHQLHPEDGDLIRFLDHELERTECHSVMAHIAYCPECAVRLESFGDQLRGLGDLVAQLDAAPGAIAANRERILGATRGAAAQAPRRRWGVRESWLRVAAALTLVAGGALGVQPVRAWVADQWGGGSQGSQAGAVAVAEAPVEQPAITLSLPPTDVVFSLSFDAPQTAGQLEIRVADVDVVSVRIIGFVEDVMALSSFGVHVSNTAQTAASYEVTVPRSLRAVTVQRAGGAVEEYRIEPGNADWRTSVPLRP